MTIKLLVGPSLALPLTRLVGEAAVEPLSGLPLYTRTASHTPDPRPFAAPGNETANVSRRVGLEVDLVHTADITEEVFILQSDLTADRLPEVVRRKLDKPILNGGPSSLDEKSFRKWLP